MSDRPTPPLDVKALWKSQPREIAPVALATIRRDAKQLQRRRLRVLIRETLAAIVAIVIYGLYVRFLPGLLLKIGSGLAILYLIASIWFIFVLFRPRRVPNDAAACLDFHRRELERQRDITRDKWRWALLPLIPIFAVMIVGRWIGPTPPWRVLWLDHAIIIASSIVLVETLILVWLWNRHRADRWQDQIDELDALGKEEP